jgi:hypothetical protein
MQQSSTLPTWIQTAFGLLASFLAGGGFYKLFNTWLNRRKPAAEIHVTEATASEIIVRAGSNAGDAVMRMMDRLDHAQMTIDRLRSERDDWRTRAMNAEDDSNAAQMFVDQLNAAAKLTVCEHHPHGVKLSDFTPQQLNPPKSGH